MGLPQLHLLLLRDALHHRLRRLRAKEQEQSGHWADGGPDRAGQHRHHRPLHDIWPVPVLHDLCSSPGQIKHMGMINLLYKYLNILGRSEEQSEEHCNTIGYCEN